MNRSYSKIRNINSVNYLLEQKYLEDKRNTDRGVLNEAVDRSSLTKTISDICSQGTYGSGSFTEPDVNTFAEWFKTNLTSSRKSNEELNTIAKTIKNMKTISNYCRVVVKYKEIGGRMKNNKMIDWMSSLIYYDNAWELYIKVPFEEIIKNAQTEKQKSDEAYSNAYSNPTTQASNIQQSGRPLKNDSNSDSSSQSTTSGGDFGTIYPNVFTPSVVSLIKGKIGSSDKSSSLTQDDINKLYDFINK